MYLLRKWLVNLFQTVSNVWVVPWYININDTGTHLKGKASSERGKTPRPLSHGTVNRTQSGHRSGAKPISYCTRDTDCPVFITNCTIFSFHPPPWFANHNGIDLFSSSDRHNMQRIVPRSKYTHANQTFPSNDDLPSMLVQRHRLLHAHEQCHVFQAL